ncbi:MurR/RpiR family transcriptional regulator [Staphylococcus simulans]|uniref:MurR/RpiR family transcriptional regulator n=1 Tax=Staphylococcus simulans TaxID=1286 RepID=UPI001304A2DE|nr:SIS domain-containing protein [Staphylococcus simulans]
MINKSLELLDEETIQEVIDQIESSNRITVIGVGNSGISAEELSSRLERMGYSVKAITDVHRMKMQSTLLNEDDLLIAISNSGETISVNDSAKIAEKQGATILSITNNNQSDLYQNSTKSIILSSFRNVDDERFINSQVPIIYFFDVLCYELLKIKSRKENRDKTLSLIQSIETK